MSEPARYRRILVTGSSAVLGSALRAVAPGYPQYEFAFLTSADCDLTDPEASRSVFASRRPDAVLHLAAVSGGIGLSMRHPATMLRDNLLMLFSVLEAARKEGVKKTVLTLTTGMYPVDAPLPLREESIHDGYPHDSNYGSSFAKRIMDPAVRAYREEYGMNVVGLVPGGIFGENDNFHEEDAPLVPTLIRRFYEHRLGDDPIVLWGDGTPLREYSYAQDLARIYLWALEHYDEARVLNIGSTEEHSVRDIAFMIADRMGVNRSRIRFDPSKPKGIFRKNTDNSRFLSLSGFQYTPFRTGLEKTISWFCETMEKNPGAIRRYRKSKER